MEIILGYGTLFSLLAVAFALYMTWGIGANDVANAMGTSVGSGAISAKQAIVIAALFEFSGAFFASGQVTATIRKGLIEPTAIAAQPELLVYGMLAALLAAAIWLTLASQRGWPVSTTHSIMGGIIGFAVAGIGLHAVQWPRIAEIGIAWVVSPLLSAVIAALLMLSIRKLILNAANPLRRAKAWGPLYIFLVGFTVSLVTLFHGLRHVQLELSGDESLVVAGCIGLIVALIGKRMIRHIDVDAPADAGFQYAGVESAFVPMMIFSACAMAFAHGSNDVANAIGPLAAILSVVNSAKAGVGEIISQKGPVPLWVPLLGGLGIVLGLATYGYKVIQTVGSRITALTPTRGYSATLAAALVVIAASKTGMPVSTTHIAVGAVMGVGLARGLGAVDLRVVGRILLTWLITLPAGAGMAAGLFFLLKRLLS